MAKKTVNIGTSVNKGDGDPLRTAFGKINDNFDEIYAAIGSDGSIFNPLSVDSHLLPDADNTRDLGSPAKRWRDIFVAPGSLYIGDIKLTNEAGQLVVQRVTDAGLETEAPVPNAPGVVTTDRLINGGYTVELDAGGILNLPQNPVTNSGLIQTPGDIDLNANGSYWTFRASGILTLPSDNYLETTDVNLKVGSQGSVTIRSNATTDVGTKAWTFDTDGNITLPSGGDIRNSSGQSVLGGGADIARNIESEEAVSIRVNLTDSTQRVWRFGEDGDLDVPGSILLQNGARIKDNTSNSVAFGKNAGLTSQGVSAVAIGYQAGNTSQSSSAVAVGNFAGYDSQGVSAVAIGNQAGSEFQQNNTVGVGYQAGKASQGNSAVAIGSQAGYTSQGNSAVAIGFQAGYSSQAANSIVINATGSTLNNTTANSLKVAPIRNDNTPANMLYYNTTTKEITYGAVLGGGGGTDQLSGLKLTGKIPTKIDLLSEESEVWIRPNNNEGVVANIAPGITLKRKTSGGAIYNSYNNVETSSNNDVSPLGTLWNADGWGDLADVQTRTYTTFYQACSQNVGQNVVGREFVMHDTINDQYFKVEFTFWQPASGGGAGQQVNEKGGLTMVYTPITLTSVTYFVRGENDTDLGDAVGPGLTIKRGAAGALYNSQEEQEWDPDNTPTGTLWNAEHEWEDFSDITALTWKPLYAALHGYLGNKIVGAKLLMWDTINDKYYTVKFTDWGQNNGGSFAYVRREILPATGNRTGIVFADGSYQDTATTLGDLKVVDNNVIINQAQPGYGAEIRSDVKNNFTYGTWAWTGTANWVTSGNQGYIQFDNGDVNNGNQVDFANFLGDLGRWYIKTVRINDGEPQIITSWGSNNIWTANPPAIDPTVVTEVRFDVVFRSRMYMGGENTVGFFLNDRDENFQVEARDINLYSNDDVRIRGKDFMEIRNNGTNSQNYIQITTDGSNTSKTWRFMPDGSLKLPYQQNTGYQQGYSLNGPTLLLGGENDPNEQVIITGPKPTVGARDSQRIVIQGQRGYGTWADADGAGEGGDIYIWGGVGGESQNSLGGSGGDIKVRGGAGQANGGGGYVKIEGGDVQFGNGTGGFIDINAGSSDVVNGGTGDGGNVNIRAGAGTVNNGEVHVYTVNETHHWVFKNDGALQLPVGGDIRDSNGTSVLGGGGAQLVGDGFQSATGVKRVVYTNYQGNQYIGGETETVLLNGSDVVGVQVGDTITFSNGDTRTVTVFDTDYSPQVYIHWSGALVQTASDPIFPITFTSPDYVAETKPTARIKPDIDTEGSGQYMDVYVGGSMVKDNKHVHMAGHHVDTELFLGTDNNFVSAKEAGSSPARVNLKSENDITVSDTNLRMNRGNTWLHIYGDGINRNAHGNTYDLTWNVIESDDQGNFYVGGESCAYAEAMVAKYGPDGDLLWSRLVSGGVMQGWQLDGVAYNPDLNEIAVAVQTNQGRTNNYYKINTLDSETGVSKATFDIFDPDGNIFISNLKYHPVLGYVAVGYSYGETAQTGTIMATGNSGVGIIEMPAADVKINGQWPNRNNGAWSISGTGITGSQTIQSAGPGLYQNVPVTNLTNPSATAMTVDIRVDYSSGTYEYFSMNTGGTGPWTNNDDFKIPGSYVGGVDTGATFNINLAGFADSNPDILFVSKSSYPDLGRLVVPGSWTVTVGASTYGITAVGYDGANDFWLFTVDGNDVVAAASATFTAVVGNDVLGKVADENNLQYGTITGSANTTIYRIDMGRSMGYGSTNFSGGEFTIKQILGQRAFVWTDSWNKIYTPITSTGGSSANCVAIHKDTGDILVGGLDDSNGYGFVWKLDNAGNTVWIKAVGGDTYNVYGLAVSEINGTVYFTTNWSSINKLSSTGTLLARVEASGPWGIENAELQLEQSLDGEEYVYVAGTFGAIWTANNGFMVNKLTTDLKLVWSRDFWSEQRWLNTEYDSWHSSIALGRDKIAMVGYTNAGYVSHYNAYLASIDIGDTFEPIQIGNWHVENMALRYNDITVSSESFDMILAGGAVSNSSLQTQSGTSNLTWSPWGWKTSTIKLDQERGIKGVESIDFADGGRLDHNPSDIPPVFTDFDNTGWTYTLKLSDRGKFIINEDQPGGGHCDNLTVIVPTSLNVNFPVGTVITLINTDDSNNNGFRIYVEPEDYNDAQSPKIWAAGFGQQGNSTWSFPGIQTATLMKIGSNQWLLTANYIQNED